MADEIFVIQAIPTGPDGFPYDEIVEIAICKVDLDVNEYQIVYSNTIYYDPKQLGRKKLEYLSGVSGMPVEELYGGEPEKKVAGDVLAIIAGKEISAFDGKQEFGRYMSFDPWDITYRCTVVPSVSAKMPISLKCKAPSEEPVTIRKAYRRLLRNDPACIESGRRAVHLAQMTAELMIYMRSKGKY